MVEIPRRDMLRLLGLVGGGLAVGSMVSACGDDDAAAGGEENKDIVLGVYGGPQEPVYRQYVADRLESENGANVTLALATGAERVSKVYAERERPSMDIAMLAVWDAVKGVEDGVLEAPDPNVPNADQAEDWAKQGGYMVSAFNLGMRYNPDKIEKPTSFEALWDPRYRGHVAVPDPGKNANGIAFMSMLAKMYSGGDNTKMDPVWAKLKELKPALSLQYASENDTNSLWETQDIWIAVSSSSFTWQFQFDSNASVEFVTPSEGGALMGNVACIPKGANNPELARTAIGYMLDEPFQKAFADDHYFVPTRKNTNVKPESAALFPETSSLVTLKYGELAKLRPEWADRWTREMTG